MKTILTKLVLLSCINFLHAQLNFESQLDSIQSEMEAQKFINSHKLQKGKIIIFNKEKHHTRLANELYELSIGGKKVYEDDLSKTYYKVIEKRPVPHFRISYILIDNKDLSASMIDELKNKIIYKYKNGYRFEDLASQYSMDNSAYTGGDSGWLPQGSFYPEVEQAIWGNQTTMDDIMSVDVPEKKLTFLILKTHSAKDIEEIKVLKMIKEAR